MKRDWPRVLVDIGSWLSGNSQSPRSSKGTHMIISETTIATSVMANVDLTLQKIASQAAVNLVLAATASLNQATLTSQELSNGTARATVRGQEPESAVVTITVTTLANEPIGQSRKRVLMSALIVVATETVDCAQRLTNALLSTVPNRMIKPVVVIRSPMREQPVMRIDDPSRGELLAWRRARF